MNDPVAVLRSALGDAAVDGGRATETFAVDGVAPACVASPDSVNAVVLCLAACEGHGFSVLPVGNGTHLNFGNPPRRYDVAVSTRRLRRLVAHEVADLTVTVEAGLTVGELNSTLAESGQRLAVDPPLPHAATIGAVIATDACGPLRLAHGKVRDHLIGVRAAVAGGPGSAAGTIRGGGRVVKNVAGYDLMKLFAGSFGTLGIIVEATFKVWPLPSAETALGLQTTDLPAALALAAKILAAPIAPLYVDVLNAAAARSALQAEGALVVVGLGGLVEEIAVQTQTLSELRGNSPVSFQRDGEAAAGVYAAVRDWPAAPRDGEWGCSLSLRPQRLAEVLATIEQEAGRRGVEAEILARPGSGAAVLRFGRAEDTATVTSFAAWLTDTIAAASGWIVFDPLPSAVKRKVCPWGPEPPGLALMRGIKNTLDPSGLFCSGRFVGGI